MPPPARRAVHESDCLSRRRCVGLTPADSSVTACSGGCSTPDGPSIGLVLGPPGSGKTTLLTRVVAATDEPSAWYRAGAEDDDEAALVRHLASGPRRGAGRAGAQRGGGVGQRGRPGRPRSSDCRAAPCRLVVDDLHEIAGSRAERALERFVLLRPRWVRLLLGSRRPPALNTTRLLVSGRAVPARRARTCGSGPGRSRSCSGSSTTEPLSPEAAAALTRRTGGWAAGLQLFHLATAG